MDRIYTWNGHGYYRDDDIIWTHDGGYVGDIVDYEVYDRYGNYIGEIHRGRLITDCNKREKRIHGHKSRVIQSGYVNTGHEFSHGRIRRVNGNVMLVDYEDFPKCD
ncbi:MAG: hypothetical protein WC364_03735 [Eubacteriales bacterium]